ncbi:isoleucine--tRNA ligase [bacterium]|nr:isoleucine--tRNA ligase [bacterium]
MGFKEISTQINFAKEEEKILKTWNENKIFEKSVAQRSLDNMYTFYDGPPFATGLPHYGHLLAGILKDIIPRYWTMKGFRVERRFGWDCHGLPVEYEIDKKLGISGSAGVEKFGIAKYNEECRSIVLRYTAEWEKTVNRIGRWVDFKNDYKTMDPSFMESVWWVFKQLWDKGLVYQGYRVMPYSTAVSTPLSNFEAGQNYRDVQDPSITLLFTVLDQENTHFLAWTTTPWTLPSNLALCVGPDIDYVKIYDPDANKNFILAQARLSEYYHNEEEYTVVERYKGSDLEGWRYEPLMSYFAAHAQQGAFRVLLADFVTTEDGTGVVHTAPAFGEEDYNVCLANKIEIVMPVDNDGLFTSDVKEFEGRYVKDADKEIISMLKKQGKVVKQSTITHSYPFCWRSDTPLIYRAISAWFVNVEKIKEDLLQSNKETHWVPEVLRDGRFGKWLENARDWNVSRNRYWGNPLPLWKNDETDDVICVGSIKELEELSGQKITDLHREHLDDLTIEIKGKSGVYKRVSEVLDCWFESGAMPYAQCHYPFENKEAFEKGFPADFIAEGLDQTRGWFYTLVVLGTALFGRAPFKNVVVNGMVLAEDGKKMSKRLKNYPDPSSILDAHGADALRLYMIQSPVVRAEELRFSETGVKDIVRRILLKWWNAYTFFISYAVIDNWSPAESDLSPDEHGDNILDHWIISRVQTLLATTEKEMANYHLYNVVPALLAFIEDLTNIYIRLNRKRFWGEDNSADKNAAYHTLYYVLYSMSTVMAPFTPFLAELTFENLKQKDDFESVHLKDFPLPEEHLIREHLEESVDLLKRVILIVRNMREKKNLKVKIPLKKLSIIHRDSAILKHLKSLENYIKEELNVRAVAYLTNEDDFVELSAKANGAALGKRLGKKFGEMNKAIMSLDTDAVVRLERGDSITLLGESITADDVMVYRKPKKGHEHLVSDAYITVELDTTLDEDQILEGLAREVVNRVQKLRKTANLKLSDRIFVEYQAMSDVKKAIENNLAYIKEQTLALDFTAKDKPQGDAQEVCQIEKKEMTIAITKAGSLS